MVQQKVKKKTGKPVTIRDIHNIVNKSKESTNVDNTSEVRALADFVQEEYPSLDTEFVIDENGHVNGIYMQDQEMKSIFQRFPEVILADATHKTNTQEMPFFAMMAVDGDGKSKLVAAFLVQNEEEVTLRKMIQLLKERNPDWTKIQVIIHIIVSIFTQ